MCVYIYIYIYIYVFFRSLWSSSYFEGVKLLEIWGALGDLSA